MWPARRGWRCNWASRMRSRPRILPDFTSGILKSTGSGNQRRPQLERGYANRGAEQAVWVAGEVWGREGEQEMTENPDSLSPSPVDAALVLETNQQDKPRGSVLWYRPTKWW